MPKVKSLYKLTRELLFYKEYYCEHCGMMDFDKYYIRRHIKYEYDEYNKEKRMFTCKKCYETMQEFEILKHEC